MKKSLKLNKNLKIFFLFCLMFQLLIILTSCRPTPDIPPVINRSGGIPANTLIEPLADGQVKVIDAPIYWNETLERGSGKISIEADLNIKLPEVQNTPIIELAQKNFGEERLGKLISYFAGKHKLYRKPPMTKTELTKHLSRMESKEGKYGSPDAAFYLSMNQNNLRSLIKLAPESVDATREYINPQFTYPVQTEYSYMRGGEDKNKIKSEKNSFYALVETGQAAEAFIQATSLNKKAGTTGNFTYSRGSSFDETDVASKKEGLERYEQKDVSDNEWLESYRIYVESLQEMLGRSSISKDRAITEATKTLNSLGITELELFSVNKALWVSQSDIWDEMDVDWSVAKTGYTLTYCRTVGNLAAYQQMSGTIIENLPETVYAPPFFQEILTITITEDGIQKFTWENMAQIEKVIAENTKLLPFAEIKERLADHMLYLSVAVDEANNIDSMAFTERYVVREVQLRTTYSDAYNAPDRAWLVPVWVFEMDWYLTSKGKEEILREPQTVMINAIDGGYIAIAREVSQ